MQDLDDARKLAESLKSTPNKLAAYGLKINADGNWRSALDLLSYPDIAFDKLVSVWPELGTIAPEVIEQLEIDGKYAGYMERQDMRYPRVPEG